MHAHAADLRAEIERGGEERDAAAISEAVLEGWRGASLTEHERALCAYAEKLTRSPQEMTEADILTLREAGLDDVSIHDLIQVCAYFNYINRIADAVHVDLEPEMPPYPDPSA
ncbi:MAG: peroxidase [Planctomycetes bacterium]|nr:peroxidase [Planctomycetota bacterium]